MSNNLVCPNCGALMKDRGYSYFSIASWNCDYPDCYHEEYQCSKCHINFIDGEWEIPENLKPTTKQLNTIKFIQSKLPQTVNFEPVTKVQTWDFISKYFDDAKLRKNYTIENIDSCENIDLWDYESAGEEQW